MKHSRRGFLKLLGKVAVVAAGVAVAPKAALGFKPEKLTYDQRMLWGKYGIPYHKTKAQGLTYENERLLRAARKLDNPDSYFDGKMWHRHGKIKPRHGTPNEKTWERGVLVDTFDKQGYKTGADFIERSLV